MYINNSAPYSLSLGVKLVKRVIHNYHRLIYLQPNAPMPK